MTYQITPNGLLSPIEGISLDLRSNDDSFKVSFSPGRIDFIRNKIRLDDEMEPIGDFINKVERIVGVIMKTYSAWSINRLAIRLTICYDLNSEQLKSSYNRFVINAEPNIIEWRLRKVARKQLIENSEISVNQVATISRAFYQIGFEEVPKDRVLLETDFNTAIGQDVVFDSDLIKRSLDKMTESTLTVVSEYNRILTE